MTRRTCAFLFIRRRVHAGALVALAALGLAAACLFPGCSGTVSPWDFKKDEPPPPPFTLPRTSPENVLYNFRAIYDGADYFVETEADTLQWGGMYRALFHPDSFKFYFLPGDQSLEYPDGWWGVAEEVASFENLLLHKVSGVVQGISLSWTVNPSEPDNRPNPEALSQLLHPTWRRIYVTGILLDVYEGEIDHRVANATADFYFAPDPANSTLWVITEWFDRQPVGGSPPSRVSAAQGSSTTWGRIKQLYH